MTKDLLSMALIVAKMPSRWSYSCWISSDISSNTGFSCSNSSFFTSSEISYSLGSPSSSISLHIFPPQRLSHPKCQLPVHVPEACKEALFPL